MNLSKVYSTDDTFEPEDLVSAKLNTPMVFGSIVTDKLPEPLPEPAIPKREEPTPEEVQQMAQQLAEQLEGEDLIQNRDVAQPKPPPPESEPIQEHPPGQVETQPPPQPPGIPAEEVDRLVTESYEKGLTAGLQQAEQDFGAATSSLLLVCQQLDSIRETILKNSVGEMQELVLAIAEKIIRHSVQEQNDTIHDTIEEAIQKAAKSDEFDVYVHPDDYQIVADKSEEFVSAMNGLNSILVKKDNSVDRGGCRVESDNCVVDATVVSQLEIIRDSLHDQD